MFLCKNCFRQEFYCTCIWTEFIHTDKLFKDTKNIKIKNKFINLYNKMYNRYELYNLSLCLKCHRKKNFCKCLKINCK